MYYIALHHIQLYIYIASYNAAYLVNKTDSYKYNTDYGGLHDSS